ncbi:MAG TPA: hypothetical protein VFZ53_18950 [Polyangiaceae bacterium]
MVPDGTQARENADALAPVLSELEAVLSAEAQALRQLDRPAIERAMADKLRLCEAIASHVGKPAPSSRERLERIRRQALKNQLLLAHARDSVRDVLSLASGQTAGGSSPPLGGLRVNLRG